MIVTLRRVMLEIPMMVVIVVGVRGDGDLVVRRGQMDRRRRRSLRLLLLDAQMPGDSDGAAMLLMLMMMMMMMMVVRRDADGGGGRFRVAGAVLDGGKHRVSFNRDHGCSSGDRRSRLPWHPARSEMRETRFRECRAIYRSTRISRDGASKPSSGDQVKINALDRELLAPIGVDIEDLDLFRS